MGPREPLAAVLDGVADTGEPTVEEGPLQVTGALAHLVLLDQLEVLHALGQARHGVGQPLTGALAKDLDVLRR